jgi:hypothetical protein
VSVAALLVGHLGHGWGYVDLTVYRYGGEAILHGARLYDLRFPGALAFTYPPVSALLFTGLTVPSPQLTHAPLTGVSLVLLPLMLGFALRLAPLRSALSHDRVLRLALLAAALAVWLEPVWTTLRYGQIDLLIGALIFYDLSRPDGSRWKGAALGVAVALKLTPAIFAVYLLLGVACAPRRSAGRCSRCPSRSGSRSFPATRAPTGGERSWTPGGSGVSRTRRTRACGGPSPGSPTLATCRSCGSAPRRSSRSPAWRSPSVPGVAGTMCEASRCASSPVCSSLRSRGRTIGRWRRPR